MTTDVTGYRSKIGVIVPSTNTVVEHDTSMLAPHGITFHTGRMYISDPAMDNNTNFENLILQIRAAVDVAVRDVMTCKPELMMMGMSAETFWGGVEGNANFIKRVEALTGGLPVTTGASSCRAALACRRRERPPILHRGRIRCHQHHRASHSDGDGNRRGRRARGNPNTARDRHA
jgi:maleate isomerase